MPRKTLGERRNAPRHPTKLGPILGRHRKLLGNPRVRSWWEARSLRSRLSADQYLRQFGFLLERLELEPASVVALAKTDPDALRDLLVRDAAKLKRAGRLDSYISKFHEGLRSYFRFHHVPFDGFPALSPIKGASLTAERVPTPEELGRVLDRLSVRGRVCALFMAHSGLRPGVLGSYQAEAGLTLADLPDLHLGKRPALAEEPFVVRVPAQLSKSRVSYTTFGSSQLASTLLAYLTERLESGEELTLKSPVISVRPTRGVASRRRTDPRFKSGFVVTKAVVGEIHDALKSTAPEGVRWRPYVLRAYCSSRLLMAEGAGELTRDLREAMLGHDLGNSGRYTLGKTWGEDMLRGARAAYKRCESFLSTVPTKSDSNEAADRVFKALLEARGMAREQAQKIDISEKSDAELVEMFKKLGASSAPRARSEKAFPVDDVPRMCSAAGRSGTLARCVSRATGGLGGRGGFRASSLSRTPPGAHSSESRWAPRWAPSRPADSSGPEPGEPSVPMDGPNLGYPGCCDRGLAPTSADPCT